MHGNFLMVVGAAVVLSVCGVSSQENSAGFVLENGADVEVHIFVQGNESFDAKNKIPPGASIGAQYVEGELVLPIVVAAGRSGTVLATTTCPEPGWNGQICIEGADLYEVVFTETAGPALTCERTRSDPCHE